MSTFLSSMAMFANGFFLPVVALHSQRSASPYSRSSTSSLTRWISTVSSTQNENTNVSLVSVCTAELCQCQGDEYANGGAADALICNLRARRLPFTVDESGCLGACGMGTMVAIDYNDGSASLVAGLQETLLELGIVPQLQVDKESVTSANNNNDVVTSVDVEFDTATTLPAVTVVPTSSGTPDSSATNTNTQPVAATTKTSSLQEESSYKNKESFDARDRMRSQAAADKVASTNNPWASMAGYLAKKVGEKMFGE